MESRSWYSKKLQERVDGEVEAIKQNMEKEGKEERINENRITSKKSMIKIDLSQTMGSIMMVESQTNTKERAIVKSSKTSY